MIMLAPADRMTLYKRVIILTLIVAVSLTFLRAYYAYYFPGETAQPPLPFGAERIDNDNHQLFYRDFLVLMTFSHQVWHHQIERPYSLDGQKQSFYHWFPDAEYGLNVAYAPTVLLWTWPLQLFSGQIDFLLMSLVNAVILFALARAYLFPRATCFPHLLLIGLGLINMSLFFCLTAAHNSILSCGVIALTWSWIGDRDQHGAVPLGAWKEFALALLLFVLSAKPHVAFTLGLILLAAKLWRPVAAAVVAFVVSVYCLSPLLGGWPTWFNDYLALVIGHSQEKLGDFLYYGPELSSNFYGFIVQVCPIATDMALRLDSLLWAGGLLVAILFRCVGKLSLRHFFYAVYSLFFLFSPSLSLAEDWVIVLLVAEVPLFKQNRSWPLWAATALLLFVALNLRQFPNTGLAHIPLLFPAKFLLVALGLAFQFVKPEAPVLQTSGSRA